MAREIPLTQGKSAIIDDEDYEMLSAFKWHFRPMRSNCREKGYARRSVYLGGGRIQHIFMHRMLLDLPEGKQCDHINGNSLDYRRSNLRISTQAQNTRNAAKHKNGRTSRFKGVIRLPSGHWYATIRTNGHQVGLGTFQDEQSAARAYDEAARRAYGEFARVNFPLDGYGRVMVTSWPAGADHFTTTWQ